MNVFLSDNISPEAEEVLSSMSDAVGVDFTPNFFATMTQSVDVLKGMSKMYSCILGKGFVQREVKELIFLAIAFELKCEYCVTFHSFVAKSIGIENYREIVLDIESVKNTKLREALKFSVESATNAKKLTTQRIEEFKKVGISIEELIEIITLSSFAVSVIKMSQAQQTPVDQEALKILAGDKLLDLL